FGGEEHARLLHDPLYAQPILFCLQFAVVEALAHLSVEPDMLVGHSLGEIVALAVSGVIPLQDAAALVQERARDMAGAPDGMMLLIAGSAGESAADLAGTGVHLAACNGPSQFVYAGKTRDMEAFEGRLHAQGLTATRLDNRRPFHTPLMADCL